ncbi:DUF1810 domain-containing protein [Ramlibacter sp. MMS24-I3-19]|uniref:DUF1810 domain-containing protein n=1 Tax=Ramlibacter sp. MMS24-I3-19 TaxID=3416606 RepID=UPI003D0321E6
MAADPFDLQRFVTAQDTVWADVLAELRAGLKQSHWMWFVFPQLATLGRSSMARRYGLSGVDEARAYLMHPVLGPRLLECCQLLLHLRQHDAVAIFGETDAMKLRSCLTLFAEAAQDNEVFSDALRQYFGGTPDPLTTAALR